MKRVEAGDWTLGTTVGEIDASWGEKWSGITLEQLLSHGSGIPNYFGSDSSCFTEVNDLESSASSAVKEFASDNEVSPPVTAIDWKKALAQPVPMREVLVAMSEIPLVFEPGLKHCYSNTNYALLGVLLEKHHDAPLAAILHREVFRPVGMHDTYLATEPGFRGPHIVGRYTLGGETVMLDDTHPSIYDAAGALVATPLDMSKFHKALGEGTLLSKETVAEMRKPRSFMVDEGFAYGAYGLGTMALLILCGQNYEVAYGHNGATMGTLSNSYSNAEGTRSFTVAVSGRDDDHVDKPTSAQVAAGAAMYRGYMAICPNAAELRSVTEKPSNLLLELSKVRPIQDITPHNGHQTAQSGQKLPKK